MSAEVGAEMGAEMLYFASKCKPEIADFTVFLYCLLDLKSCDHCGRAGSSPARGTTLKC